MPSWVWIPITIAAAGFQTARNAFQRGLVGEAGPWGATLVRFAFGLPFAAVWLAAATLLDPPQAAVRDFAAFAAACVIGATAQVVATAALLVAMRRASFAIGTAFQQSSLPFSALVGLGVGDTLAPLGWAGVALATVGLAVLSWPKEGAGRDGWSAAAFGLASGAAFAISANAFRVSAHALAPGDPVFGAAASLVVVQILQTVGLGAWLAFRDPAALRAALAAGRRAWGAGFCGAAASIGWFTAVALAPAAAVRAVGVVDMPMAAWAGRRLFAEHLGWRQIFGAVATAAGVVAASLGHS
ncbi:MAG: EamA/RhaT family transporter [Alphaproteobacteria bacterium]|nr:EamA/RhaT family transporter [Alphaproteobacteria bacterium]